MRGGFFRSVEKYIDDKDFYLVHPSVLLPEIRNLEKRNKEKVVNVEVRENFSALFAFGLASSGNKTILFLNANYGFSSFFHIFRTVISRSSNNLDLLCVVDGVGLELGSVSSQHYVLDDVALFSNSSQIKIHLPSSSEDAYFFTEEFLSQSNNTIQYMRLQSQFVVDAGVGTTRMRLVSKPDCVLVTYGLISSEVMKASGQLNSSGIKTKVVVLKHIPYEISLENEIAIDCHAGTVFVLIEEGVKNTQLLNQVFHRVQDKRKVRHIYISDNPLPYVAHRKRFLEKYRLDATNLATQVETFVRSR